ncbi:MAG: NAAT family transporter [Haliea sp.]|jgi:multiple antibiotic resistance protein|nr:NAAT family transporter [Haliea sp.]
MEGLATHLLAVFMGFFAIMNPIANTPVFLGLTAGDDAATRRRVATRALFASALIIIVFCAAGKFIFTMFGITLPAFRITGGILVGLVGFHMLQGGENSSVQHPSDEDTESSLQAALDKAISPLAMPILAGPGTIATAMNYASAGTVTEFVVTVSAFVTLCVITWVFFVSGERLVAFIGDNGVKVITRLMGLILAVIGVQMLISGIGGAVSAYAG